MFSAHSLVFPLDRKVFYLLSKRSSSGSNSKECATSAPPPIVAMHGLGGWASSACSAVVSIPFEPLLTLPQGFHILDPGIHGVWMSTCLILTGMGRASGLDVTSQSMTSSKTLRRSSLPSAWRRSFSSVTL
jgi:hypothetical protein